MTAEPAVPCHRSLQIDLAPDSEFTWEFTSSQLRRKGSWCPEGEARRTQVCPGQSLVRQPDFEPSLVCVEAGDGQAAAVDGDRVSELAVSEDVVGVGDDERVAFEFGRRVDRLYGAESLTQLGRRSACGVCSDRLERDTVPDLDQSCKHCSGSRAEMDLSDDRGLTERRVSDLCRLPDLESDTMRTDLFRSMRRCVMPLVESSRTSK